jgi:putative ABC transport system permease protein
VACADIARGFFRFVETSADRSFDLSLDFRVVAAGFALALATGAATGIAPALQSTRTGALPALKDDTAGAGSRRTRLREALIVLQVAVSVLLLAASGLMVRSFLIVHRRPGFNPDEIIVTRLRPSLVGYTAERSWAFQREVIRRLEALPGVIAASPANMPPLPRYLGAETPVRIPGEANHPATAYLAATTPVGPRYFKTLGVPLIEGREFDDRDRPGGAPVAIVNETLARHFWPSGGATGQAVTVGDRSIEIIGVVKNIQFLSAIQQPEPILYLDYWQQDSSNNWAHDSRTHVRVSGDPAAMLPKIRRTIAEIDPDVPVSNAQPLGASLDTAFADLRAARAFLVTFGLLALVLSTVGLYATLAFAVGQRTREIAIRIALGAARTDVGCLVLERGAIIILLGVIAGLAASRSPVRI